MPSGGRDTSTETVSEAAKRIGITRGAATNIVARGDWGDQVNPGERPARFRKSAVDAYVRKSATRGVAGGHRRTLPDAPVIPARGRRARYYANHVAAMFGVEQTLVKQWSFAGRITKGGDGKDGHWPFWYRDTLVKFARNEGRHMDESAVPPAETPQP
ncbi:hypothetical protein [Streptomyces sp. NPDC087300]|uniref:hypothetical protein n=1 Tax=Streptomyces sp. NPDC087300 TaxID=3365780 RepID=UPI0038257E78